MELWLRWGEILLLTVVVLSILLQSSRQPSGWWLLLLFVSFLLQSVLELIVVAPQLAYSLHGLLLVRWGPLLYIYTTTFASHRSPPNLWKHSMLPLLHVLLVLWSVIGERLAANQDPPLLLSLQALSVLFSLAYYGFISILSYQKAILNTEIRERQARWLKIVIGVYMIMVAISVVFVFLAGFLSELQLELLESVLSIFAYGIILVSAYRLGILHPPTADANTTPVDAPDERWQKLFATLNQQICRESWFTDPTLTVDDLAKRIGINSKYISKAINTTYGTSATQYLNDLRIECCKAKLANTDYHHLTLSAISLDCGFRSKSSFNRIFKEKTGQTPSQYRSQFLETKKG